MRSRLTKSTDGGTRKLLRSTVFYLTQNAEVLFCRYEREESFSDHTFSTWINLEKFNFTEIVLSFGDVVLQVRTF